MRKTIELEAVRRDLDQILEGVAKHGDRVVVDRDGQRLAVILPINVYDRLQREWDELFDSMEESARRANMSEEEADELISEAIAWARSQPRS